MREKNREASAASSRSASLDPFLSTAAAMLPNPSAAPIFPRRHRGLYDLSGEAPVCAAQHIRPFFRLAIGALAEAEIRDVVAAAPPYSTTSTPFWTRAASR